MNSFLVAGHERERAAGLAPPLEPVVFGLRRCAPRSSRRSSTRGGAARGTARRPRRRSGRRAPTRGGRVAAREDEHARGPERRPPHARRPSMTYAARSPSASRQHEARARLELHVEVDEARERRDGRARAERLAREHAHDGAGARARRERLARVVMEGGRAPPRARAAGRPRAGARARASRCARSAGGVRSECTMPRPAVIQLMSPGADRLQRAQAVAVVDLALVEVGHRREVDVRVRPHVEAAPRQQRRRPEVIEEDERPHGAPLAGGQHAPHEEPVAEVALARLEHEGDGLGRGDVVHAGDLSAPPDGSQGRNSRGAVSWKYPRQNAQLCTPPSVG